MIFKASVDYGIRAVVYLAVADTVCSSREISEQMSIPRDYLIQLALHLRNAGLIKAHPGKNGGYELAKTPAEITLGEIITIFDTDLKAVSRPIRKQRKSVVDLEKVRQVHKEVADSFAGYLNAITIQRLIDALETDKPISLLIAEDLETEAERLRKAAR